MHPQKRDSPFAVKGHYTDGPAFHAVYPDVADGEDAEPAGGRLAS